MFQKSDESVKFQLIRNLVHVLKLFNTDAREDLVDLYLTAQKDQRKWRYRKLIATQIPQLLELYSQDTIFSIIMPISFKLCQDVVYDVRTKAAEYMHLFILRFSQPLNQTFLVMRTRLYQILI